MHRNQLVRRVAMVTVGTAMSVVAVGGPASAASAHGANHSGVYDSTRDGSASKNGNGGGRAAGKPCAGCVGKADNKNPKGQLPGGSDRNAGYECDRNHGIGRGNPAHTSCTNVGTTTITVEPASATRVPVAAAPAVVPATTASAATRRSPAHARPAASARAVTAVMAATRTDRARGAAVLGVSVTRSAIASPAVTPPRLPFTGAPVRGLLLLALVALAAGVGLAAGVPSAGRKPSWHPVAATTA